MILSSGLLNLIWLSNCEFLIKKKTPGFREGPPQAPRGWVRSGEGWEKIGARWFPRFAGVIMIESVKQVYATTPRRRRALTPVRALLPVGQTDGVASRDGIAPCSRRRCP